MGFLDHATNNIIVDAVLTKKGREFLAANAGSFHISHFTLGDDEVDYSIIKQYGRTVGKEKIEKNTPILEATTTSHGAIRHPLITMNEDIIYYPTFTISSNNFSSNVLSLGQTTTATYNASESVSVRIATKDKLGNKITTATSFLQEQFTVEVDSRLVNLSGVQSESTDSFDKRTLYTVPSVVNSTNNDLELTLVITVKSTVSTNQTEFDKYKASGQSFIRTYVRLSGNTTGLSKIFEIRIYDT